MVFFSQQIEGIEAMLDEQADQEQVDNSSLSPNKDINRYNFYAEIVFTK